MVITTAYSQLLSAGKVCVRAAEYVIFPVTNGITSCGLPSLQSYISSNVPAGTGDVNETLYVTLALTGAHSPTGNLLLPSDETAGKPTHWAKTPVAGKSDKIRNVTDNTSFTPDKRIIVGGLFFFKSSEYDYLTIIISAKDNSDIAVQITFAKVE
jgi:hypothetical protein